MVTTELPIACSSSCIPHSVIQFLCDKKHPSHEIHHQLIEVYGRDVMKVQYVRKWRREFCEGCQEVHDNTCPHTARVTRSFWKNLNGMFSNIPVLSWPDTIWFCIIPHSEGCFEWTTFFVRRRSWVIHSHFFFKTGLTSILDQDTKNTYTAMINAWTVKVIMSKNDIYNEK